MNSKKINWWASSYSNAEKIKYLRDRIMLPSKRNKNHFPDIQTHAVKLQTGTDKLINIGFTGDLMPVGQLKLKPDSALLDFFNEIDILVINLEGIITKKKRYLALSHDESILDFIFSLANGKKILINVANNHSGDFGSEEFYHSIQKIESFGFETFGYKDKPFADVGQFRFYSASYWSNQLFYDINRFDFKDLSNINCFLNADKVNIFVPHWGYEMQLFPSENQVKFIEKIIQDWDIIAGNHTHCPQPCVYQNINGRDKLIAYSMGNFAYSHYNPNHYFGAMLNLKFGCNTEKPFLSAYEYKLTRMIPDDNEIKIEFIQFPQYKNLRREKLRKLLRLKINRKLIFSNNRKTGL